ncbi:MAG: FAD-binding oxidoreductase [marine benthic group bacterium]|nr:FAD-binding oxidoreductase [Gemmatimonadota bacterium]
MKSSTLVSGSEQELAEALAALRTRGRESEEAVPGPEVVVTGSARPDPAPLLDSFPGAVGSEDPDPIVLTTARLSEVIEFRPRDLTIEVGAGMRMRELLRLLEERGLWLPVSGEGLERSVGGWVAAASPSMWDSAFGPVRRQLLGCRMLTTAGETLNWGRHVMKNVAGYDLPRLLAGSRGRLGVLTRVTLRLWPGPENTSVLSFPGESGWDQGDFSGADARVIHVSRDGELREIAVFAGREESVRRRRAALHGFLGSDGLHASEPVETGIVVPPPRTPGSTVYRLTPGRRYLASTLRSLVDTTDRGRPAIRAWPRSGSMLARFDTAIARERLQSALDRLEFRSPGGDPMAAGTGLPVGLERGGPADLEWAQERRQPSAVAIESRIEKVFGAWPRSWLADHI